MSRWAVISGILAGLIAAVTVISQVGGLPQPETWKVLSDCDGTIKELVIHYEPKSSAIVLPVYRRFLPLLGEDVTVHVVCPDKDAFEELSKAVEPTTCRMNSIPVGHEITSWSRDRWLAISDRSEITLLRPRGEAGAEHWPARAGDERTAGDIARSLAPGVRELRSRMFFDGGDFVADGEAIFVTPRVAERNIKHTVKDREELKLALSDSLGKKIILLDEGPPHHMGMYLMAAGGGTVVVGDPKLGRKLTGEKNLPFEADFGKKTQRLFDSVAERCESEGRRVVRIPTVPGSNGRTYLTYLNVIIDERDGNKIVYMPVYRGFDELNRAGAEVWESAGFEVREIDCTSSYKHFGSLRCLVNVLRRG